MLLVCVGNICRSPMAEALMRDALKGSPEIGVSSAGLGALVGYPAAAHSLTLMSKRGLDISAHRARQITDDLIREADLILVMETGHKGAIDLQDPTARGKVHRLCEWQDQDIADPHRQPIKAFEAALVQIDLGVRSWADKIAASKRTTATKNVINEG